MVWQTLEHLENPGESVRADLQVDSAGHYRYRLLRQTAAPRDEGAQDDAVWQIAEVSGLYDWRGTCRNDAQRALSQCGPAHAGPE
jgi:hypothetical protein